jgi:hypothetical protein
MQPFALSPVVLVLIVASRAASAACTITHAVPTTVLPTIDEGQRFSFVASADCVRLGFSVPFTTLTKVPIRGELEGSGRRYTVALSPAEWDRLMARPFELLAWTITGVSAAGEITRLSTTNDLDADRDSTTRRQGDVGACDHAPDHHPNATEICDGVDNDCDGVADDECVDISFVDAFLVGEPGSGAGYGVAGAGDVDGDGHDDLLLGAPSDNSGGLFAGAAYLVRGPVIGRVDLALADAKLVGEAAGDSVRAVSGAGDVNRDGHEDLLLGAWGNDVGGSEAGAAYVVLGPVSGRLDLGHADAKLVGEEASDIAGVAVSGGGDVDGDGRDDVLIGARNGAGGEEAGAAYLLLGPVTGRVDLAVADAKLVGEEAGDSAGFGVAIAGDLDADGLDDLLVSAHEHVSRVESGAVYVVLGPVTGTVDLSRADAELVGEHHLDIPIYVAGAGDVDGDGHDDAWIGAMGNDEGGREAGAAYLVLGPVPDRLNLALADAKLVGEGTFSVAAVVAAAGDTDGDGHDDVIVGAPYHQGRTPYAGTVYLVRGPFAGHVDLAAADAKLGPLGDEAGHSLSGAGDVDGDGLGDLLLGVPGSFAGGAGSGGAYLVYGAGL